MSKYSIRRRFITLIEIMIVMFLIALITGVIAYNYRGSLDEGKAFKTKAGVDKIETILNLELAKNPGMRDEISSNWYSIIETSPLVHDPRALTTDGWGEAYEVRIDSETNGVLVSSRKYEEYKQSHRSLFSD